MKYILIIVAAFGIMALASACNRHTYKTVPCPKFHHVGFNIGR